MSYSLYIGRGPENPILAEEIEKMVLDDPCFKVVDKMETTSPSGSVITIMGPFIIWDQGGDEMCLSHRRGRIYMNYTKEEDIQRLKYLAQKLEAKVFGDGGVEY